MAALTLIIEEVEAGGYVGQIKEIPDVLPLGLCPHRPKDKPQQT